MVNFSFQLILIFYHVHDKFKLFCPVSWDHYIIVEHVLWGEGVVLDVTDSRVIIEFANGVKTLSIKTVKANGLVRPAAYI